MYPNLFRWSNDLFTLILPGRAEPVFVSAIGRNGECYGIGVYPGYRALRGPSNPLSNQNCRMCYFGDRDELLSKDREVLKALALSGQKQLSLFPLT